MKIVGILLLALVGGILAAAFSLGSGGTVWAALANYLAAGMMVTVLGLVVVIWRAFEVVRASPEMGLGSAATVGK